MRGTTYRVLCVLDPHGWLEDFNTASKDMLDEPKLYLYRGRSYSAKKVFDMALEDFNKAIELDNQQVGAFIARGALHYEMYEDTKNAEYWPKALDLILVAQQLGNSVPANSPVDINRDGVVNIFDLTLVAQGIGGAAAPPARGIDSATIEAWIAGARLADDGSIAFRQGIANLESLLASLIIPQETALHANYPNPFNPETWIPYQLAEPAQATITIYNMSGQVVRHFSMGHQSAGMYQSRGRAAYWDGRNQRGESVASGVYFYTLSAGEFTATRKMLIRK